MDALRTAERKTLLPGKEDMRFLSRSMRLNLFGREILSLRIVSFPFFFQGESPFLDRRAFLPAVHRDFSGRIRLALTAVQFYMLYP